MLLNDESELEPDVRLYQRLVALDREGAVGVVEAELKQRPRVEVFDGVLVPALSRAERDVARDELDETKQVFAWDVIGNILDGLEGTPDFSLASLALPAAAEDGSDDRGSASAPVRIVGLVADDTADTMVLRMLGQLLAPSGCILETIADADSSLQVAERVAEHSPTLVVVSHLPPAGLTLARYLVRRLRAQFAELPIVVGHWGETTGSAAAAQQLIGIGASRVVFTLADARAHILAEVAPEPRDAALASAPLG